MIALYLLCLAAVVCVIQYYIAKLQMRQLVFAYSCETDLAEPGQPIALTATVINKGRLPVFYGSLSYYITTDLMLQQKKSEASLKISPRLFSNRVSCSFFLLPHRMITIPIYISAEKRGRYIPGRYILETGDFLGFRSETVSGDLSKPFVVMPNRSENEGAFDTLSGYLGELSVRRFLFEDPVLTVGTRDYTGHEPMKAIAWNQTARTAKMQVHVYDHTVEADATVILNFEGGNEEQKEECLRLTRSVCEELERERISYEFITNGDIRTPSEDLKRMASGLGKRHFNAIMYGCGQSNLHQSIPLSWLIDQICRTRKSNHGYILVTPPIKTDIQPEIERLRKISDCDVCILTAIPKGGSEG